MEDSANSVIQDEIISHRIDILRVEAGTIDRVTSHLELAAQDVERKIKELEQSGRTGTVEERRLRTMFRQIRQDIHGRYRDAKEQLRSELVELSEFEVEAHRDAFEIAFQTKIPTVSLPRKAVEQIATNPILEGNPASAWWEKQELDTRQRFEQQIRLGLQSGETNDQIIRRIRGTKTGSKRRTLKRVKHRQLPLSAEEALQPANVRRTTRTVSNVSSRVPTTTGGAAGTSKRHTEALVRTAVQKVSNDTQQELYKENADIIRGQRTVATLDARTSDICMARSGGVWGLDGEPLPESTVKYKFPGPPPWHFNAIAEGELVHTERGLVPIEKVVVGDKVLTHRAEYQTVYATMRKPADSGVFTITTDTGARVTVTEDHPLAVAERGWINAGKVSIGQQLYEYIEQPAKIDSGRVSRKCVPNYGEPEFYESFIADQVSFAIPTGGSGIVKFNDYFTDQKIQKVSIDRNLKLVTNPGFVAMISSDELGEGDRVRTIGRFQHAGIIHVTRVAYEGTVYNLAVENDETYIVGGIVVHNCRSVMAPITKSWAQIIEETTGKKVSVSEVSPTVRASMDGFVPATQTYELWLRNKERTTPGFALTKLGRDRYNLWKAGKIKTYDLVDQSGRSLTIEELRNLKSVEKRNKVRKEQTKKAEEKEQKKVEKRTEVPRITGEQVRKKLLEDKEFEDVRSVEVLKDRLDKEIKEEKEIRDKLFAAKEDEKEELRKLYISRRKETEALASEVRKLQDEIIPKKIESLLPTHDNAKFKVSNSRGKVNAEQKATLRRAIRFYERHFNAAAYGVTEFKSSASFNQNIIRSSFSPSTKKLKISPYTSYKVYVHELAHLVENLSPAVLEKLVEFLKKRTNGAQRKDLKPLRVLDPRKNYKRNERGWLGGFFEVYIGKSYQTIDEQFYATEVLSVGLEYLVSNPAKLAKEDPELFDFIIGILNGD